MKTICINATELHLNISNADVMERVENSLSTVHNTITECSQSTTLKAHEKMRTQCRAMLDCFDQLFGDGTSAQVVSDPVDYRECFSAYASLFEAVIAQQQEFTDEVQKSAAKYSANRAARRAAKK